MTDYPESDDYEDDPIAELSELLGVDYADVQRVYGLFDEDAYGFTIETFERIWEHNFNNLNYGGMHYA